LAGVDFNADFILSGFGAIKVPKGLFHVEDRVHEQYAVHHEKDAQADDERDRDGFFAVAVIVFRLVAFTVRDHGPRHPDTHNGEEQDYEDRRDVDQPVNAPTVYRDVFGKPNGGFGLDLAEDLRCRSQVPILMLTAMGEPEERINGLERGADDYLVKPFEPRELLLRLNNILKHFPAAGEPVEDVQMGDVLFRPERDELSRNGEQIRLTDVEASLLGALARRPGEVLSREELIELTGAGGGGRAIDVQVTRLRRKIEQNPKLPRYLQTVRGKGYMLRPD
jgi:two-component system phosphate regulon response regulator OmpR